MQQWYNCPQCGWYVRYGQPHCHACGYQMYWQPVQQPQQTQQRTESPKPHTRKRTAKWDDAKWKGMNKELREALRHADWFHAHQMYFRLALYLHKFNKPFYPVLKESRKCYLRAYIKQDFDMQVQIMALTDSCDLCKSFDGKRYSLQEALELSPLPHELCGNGFCRCLYTLATDDRP